MPLGQAHRYNVDTRDGGFKQRRDVLYTPWQWRFITAVVRAVPERIFKLRAGRRYRPPVRRPAVEAVDRRAGRRAQE